MIDIKSTEGVKAQMAVSNSRVENKLSFKDSKELAPKLKDDYVSVWYFCYVQLLDANWLCVGLEYSVGDCPDLI